MGSEGWWELGGWYYGTVYEGKDGNKADGCIQHEGCAGIIYMHIYGALRC
jgi:hypothetical protein